VKGAAADWNRVVQVARQVCAHLDWAALGEIYCDWGGDHFWRARRDDLVPAGRALGQQLLRRVPRDGASLWVGAGIGELPVLLGEVLLHDRRVVAANLRARECEVLNAALQAAAPGVPLRYLAEDARTAAPEVRFDHLGCVSAFTDPETWPVLSDVAYGRVAPVQLDVDAFLGEREAARAVAGALFARLVRPAVVTTTAEEVAWFLEAAAAAGAQVDADEEAIATAVVGDPVGFLVVR
jgi:hypothetical protein